MSSPFAVTGSPVAPGELFAGRYVIEREIGAGGMGVVMAARHQQLGQTVAIKLLALPPDTRPDAVHRFLAEAKASARLRSEHVARVMDAGVDERGRHYIVMEYLQGADLGRILKQSGPLSIEDAAGYLLQACEGIAEAHANGIIHRDLKPENLFVTRRIDGSPLVKVVDFGISKSLAPDEARAQLSVTPGGALMGSPLYMSPEQMRVPAIVDARSDVWALGVVLYELLTDRPPFGADELPLVIAAVLGAAPKPLGEVRPELPPEVGAVIARALEKDPNRRHQNVGAFARDLTPWAPAWARDSAARANRTLGIELDEPLGAAPLSPVSRDAEPRAFASPTPRSPRSRRGLAVATGLGLTVFVGGFVMTRKQHREEQEEHQEASSPARPAAHAMVIAPVVEPSPPPVAPSVEEAAAPPPVKKPPRRAVVRVTTPLKQKARRPASKSLDPLDGRR